MPVALNAILAEALLSNWQSQWQCRYALRAGEWYFGKYCCVNRKCLSGSRQDAAAIIKNEDDLLNLSAHANTVGWGVFRNAKTNGFKLFWGSARYTLLRGMGIERHVKPSFYHLFIIKKRRLGKIQIS